jgi:hypothetical protein
MKAGFHFIVETKEMSKQSKLTYPSLNLKNVKLEIPDGKLMETFLEENRKEEPMVEFMQQGTMM